MMRGFVLAFAAILFAGTLFGVIVCGPQLLPGLFGTGLLVAGILFERRRYKTIEARAPGPGFHASGERFIDPETGLPVEVWYNPQSGERRYVALGPH